MPSCQNNACQCGFLQSSSKGCNSDSDCDCKFDWKLVALAAGGALLVILLLVWGFKEQTLANREGAELRRLIHRAAGAALA